MFDPRESCLHCGLTHPDLSMARILGFLAIHVRRFRDALCESTEELDSTELEDTEPNNLAKISQTQAM